MSAFADPADRLARGDAWRDFCDRLKAVGDRILAADFPADGTERAEGYRHLSRLTVYALQWYVDFHDPDFPAFHRYDDDVVKWGGPNADNHYLRAKIDPRATYRLTLDARGVREVIIATPEGEMQLERYRVFAERRLADLAVAPDGGVEIVLGPEPRPAGIDNWMPLHPETDHVLVRVYVADWACDAAPPVYIERCDRIGAAPARLAPATLAARLDQAASWIERTVVYWRDFLDARRRGAQANVLSAARAVPGGAADILYGAGFWELAAGQALLVECEAPRARYWSWQLYSVPWFESLDLANRVSSLNGTQMAIDPDGRFRLVIAAADPGVPNWLDTEGRTTGLIAYRWVWAETAPVPSCRTVALADVRAAVPADTPVVDAVARRRMVAARRRALARRFRR